MAPGISISAKRLHVLRMVPCGAAGMGISVPPSIGFYQRAARLVCGSVSGSFVSARLGCRLCYSRSGLARIRRRHVFDYGGLRRPNCLAPCTHGEVEAAFYLTASSA